MSEELHHQIDEWASTMLAKVEPAARLKLAQTIGRDLRRTNQARIRAQTNPDGTPFEPRKRQPKRRKKGSIRRRMFQRLASAKHMKIRATSEGVMMGFFGRAARIARVHHEGQMDQVLDGGPTVKYPARKLLGFTDADREMIRGHLLESLK